MQKFTVTESFADEIIIEKSRFAATVFPLMSEDKQAEATAVLKLLHKKYYDATHICYAYITNDSVKFSDDGEPQDTAGQPILEVIKNNNLINVIITVVRYFGGIKLGAGGLVRAYTAAAAGVLKKSEIYRIADAKFYSAAVSYKIYPVIKKVITENGGVINKEEYTEDVKFGFAVPDELNSTLVKSVFEATLGGVDLINPVSGELYLKDGRTK